MFHERGAEAAGSHEETRRIAANIAKLPGLVLQAVIRQPNQTDKQTTATE
jgi:hypothetical protein